MRMNIIFLSAIVLCLSSCAVSKRKLSEKGKLVRLLDRQENAGCNTVDKVIGENEIKSEELATNHARNLAAKSGANAIYVDEVVDNGSMVQVFATAYNCK